jgi:outer membrane protein assembly factor BamB
VASILCLMALVLGSAFGAVVVDQPLQRVTLAPGADADPRHLRRLQDAGWGWLFLGHDGTELLVATRTALVGLPLDGPGLGWRVPLESMPVDDIVVDGAEVAVATTDGWLVVVDRVHNDVRRIKTGRELHKLAGIRNGVAYIQEPVGRLVALDIDTAELLWKSPVYYSPIEPFRMGGRLVAVRSKEVVAVDIATGLRTWGTKLPARPVAFASTVGEGRVIVLDASGQLHALEGATGERAWSARLPGLDRRAARGARLRVDSAGLVVMGLSQGWFADLGGRALKTMALPQDRSTGGDAFGRWACAGTDDRSLVCVDGQGEEVFRVPVGKSTIPPLVVDPFVHVLADGDLVTVDGEAARAMARTGHPEGRLLHATVEVVLDAKMEPFGITGLYDEVAMVEVIGGEDERGCRTVTTLLDMSTAIPPELPPVLPIAIPELLRNWQTGADSWHFSEGWTHTLLDSELEHSYAVDWRGQVLSATPFEIEPETEAWLAAVLTCGADGGEYEGQILLHDGSRGRRFDGRISIHPTTDVRDGEHSCLLEIDVAGEATGVWGPPLVADQGGKTTALPWMDLHLAFQGLLPTDVVPGEGVVGSLPEDVGLRLETLLPGEGARTEWSFAPPVTIELLESVPPTLLIEGEGAAPLRVGVPGFSPLHEEEEGVFTTQMVGRWQQRWALSHPGVDLRGDTLVPLFEAQECALDRSPQEVP